jgi:hypothetical protein
MLRTEPKTSWVQSYANHFTMNFSNSQEPVNGLRDPVAQSLANTDTWQEHR